MEPTRLSAPARIGYTSVIDLGRAARSEYPHTLGEYPTKILPQVVGAFVERFSPSGDLVCDPMASDDGARQSSLPCGIISPL